MPISIYQLGSLSQSSRALAPFALTKQRRSVPPNLASFTTVCRGRCQRGTPAKTITERRKHKQHVPRPGPTCRLERDSRPVLSPEFAASSCLRDDRSEVVCEKGTWHFVPNSKFSSTTVDKRASRSSISFSNLEAVTKPQSCITSSIRPVARKLCPAIVVFSNTTFSHMNHLRCTILTWWTIV